MEYNLNNSLTLNLRQRQEQRLTPQQIQSITVLQMNTQDLLEYIRQEGEENPVIDLESPKDALMQFEELRKQAVWMNAGLHSYSGGADEELLSNYGRSEETTESLPDFLKDQIERKKLRKELEKPCQYMAMLLDDNGFLSEDNYDLLEENFTESLLQECVTIFKTLDPPGVGARDSRQSLLWQVERLYPEDELMKEMVNTYLSAIGQRRYAKIARELHVSQDAVEIAVKKITALNPYPGREFQKEQQTQYVRPDVFIVEIDQKLQVLQNNYYLPHIMLNSYYQQLMKESDDIEVRTYIREKIQRAKWLVNSVEKRGSTLQRCAEVILNSQMAFFSGETQELLPLRELDIAEKLELHPSTVSRAMRDKYLQCKQGLFPIGYFCSSGLTKEYSEQAAKVRIARIIADEDKKHPISDPKIQALLEQEGLSISRRTVTKYRISMGIPERSLRKK